MCAEFVKATDGGQARQVELPREQQGEGSRHGGLRHKSVSGSRWLQTDHPPIRWACRSVVTGFAIGRIDQVVHCELTP